jgi:hypothetical protein
LIWGVAAWFAMVQERFKPNGAVDEKCVCFIQGVNKDNALVFDSLADCALWDDLIQHQASSGCEDIDCAMGWCTKSDLVQEAFTFSRGGWMIVFLG